MDPSLPGSAIPYCLKVSKLFNPYTYFSKGINLLVWFPFFHTSRFYDWVPSSLHWKPKLWRQALSGQGWSYRAIFGYLTPCDSYQSGILSFFCFDKAQSFTRLTLLSSYWLHSGRPCVKVYVTSQFAFVRTGRWRVLSDTARCECGQTQSNNNPGRKLVMTKRLLCHHDYNI